MTGSSGILSIVPIIAGTGGWAGHYPNIKFESSGHSETLNCMLSLERSRYEMKNYISTVPRVAVNMFLDVSPRRCHRFACLSA